MRIYFNPDCSKSRAARTLLEDAGHTPTIVDYQAQPPDRHALEHLIDTLDDAPSALLRTNDAAFAAYRDPNRVLDRDRVIEILLAAPELMQRPVLEHDDRTLIARPPERVFEHVSRCTDTQA